MRLLIKLKRKISSQTICVCESCICGAFKAVGEVKNARERDVKINMFQWLHGDGVEFACYRHPESKLVRREREVDGEFFGFWGV